jgi:hypothetical protein
MSALTARPLPFVLDPWDDPDRVDVDEDLQEYVLDAHDSSAILRKGLRRGG